MHENYVWPGAYSFINSLKLFVDMFKKQLDIISDKIEETESRLNE